MVASAAATPAEIPASAPDLSGVWTSAPPNIGGGAAAPRRGGPPPAQGGAAPAQAGAAPPARRGGGGAPSNMTPEGKARVDAYNKLTQGTDDSPYAWCTGLGMPASMMGSGGYPMEILQGKSQMIIVYEAMDELRRIYFGARNMPMADRVPSRNGYSSGRWEGDTLVVETDNLVDQVDQRNTAHSDQATIVERYKLDGTDAQGRRILAVEMTMTDPVFYTSPVVSTKRWVEIPNGHALPYDCPETKWLERIEEIAAKKGVPVP